MKKRVNSIILIVIVLLSIVGCSSQAMKEKQSQPIEVTVSAASSLKDALIEIQNHYQILHPGVKIVYNMGASGSLQKQIEEGAPVDIFISAAKKQMDVLQNKNLIKEETRKDFLKNQLVLIVPLQSKILVTEFAGLNESTVKQFAMGAPESVPAGQYAQQVLIKSNIYNDIQSKIVLAKDVRTVLTYVETGNVDAGIVYKTDAAVSDKVKIVAVAPEGSHELILYPAAVLTASKQSKVAEEFLDYLTSAESIVVFERYGFLVNR